MTDFYDELAKRGPKFWSGWAKERGERHLQQSEPGGWINSYYYGFDPTGVPAIDAILGTVAIAGKAFHHTEFWDDDEYLDDGTTLVGMIQLAAKCAADVVEEQQLLLIEAERQRDEARRVAERLRDCVEEIRDGWEEVYERPLATDRIPPLPWEAS